MTSALVRHYRTLAKLRSLRVVRIAGPLQRVNPGTVSNASDRRNGCRFSCEQVGPVMDNLASTKARSLEAIDLASRMSGLLLRMPANILI